jgi:hypothetical protein
MEHEEEVTARERFVESIRYLHGCGGTESELPKLVEAFADAVCNCPDYDCGGAESKFYETEHKECRAALLKECGLGE